MESIRFNLEGYKILFFQKNSFLSIYIQGKNGKVKDNIKFKSIQLRYDDKFKDHFNNFKDLIKHINDKTIAIIIKEEYFQSPKSLINEKSYLKCLNIELKNEKEQKVIFSKRIYPLNVEYYLVKGSNKIRENLQPFYSFVKKNDFNLEDIKELLDKENLLSKYNIDSYKYYNEEKGVFEEIQNKNIQIKNKIILEFHINKIKNYLIINKNWVQNFLKEEIIKIKNMINKLSDKATKYDLIYLYASPIIQNDGHYTESVTPISYMEEIRIILNLMKNKKSKFKCKFECINDKVLRNIISSHKTKILHISAHGVLKNKYSLILENVQKNGQIYELSYNLLKDILNINSINVSKLDLVIISTCHSEDFGKLFIEYGAKNVIYIDKKTEINDTVSVIFTEYFYDNLIKGYTIKESFDNAITKMKSDDKISNINYSSCCCDHYHEPNCLGSKLHDLHKKTIREKNQKIKLCNCENLPPNQHYINKCEYYNKILDEEIKKGKIKYENLENNIIKICCCDLNIEHDEILKIKREQKSVNYLDISPFSLNGKGKLDFNTNIRYYFEDEKYSSILGRKSLMGKILENINNNEKYIILFGEKGLGKIVFSESFCVFLYERRIINNYELFHINSKFDFNYMITKINKTKENNINNKKNIQVIKFAYENDKNNFESLIDIYQKYFVEINRKDLYFIFIFDKKEQNDEEDNYKIKKSHYKNYVKNILKEIEDKNVKQQKFDLKEDNIFYAGLSEYASEYLLKYYLKDVSLKTSEKSNLLKKAKYRPKEIKIISKLLIKGESVEDILKKDKLESSDNEFLEKHLTYPLYYLLYNMPSGLPDCFLELIIEDYDNNKYDKKYITKSINDKWNIINKDKKFYANFKENRDIKSYYEYLFKTLKIYTILLNYNIEFNRNKIIYKDGTIHYVYNSYNSNAIWKNKVINTFGKKLSLNIFNKDFNIHKHKKNIINLISLIINNIELLREKEENFDYYIECILLLFPSYFFLDIDNIKLLQFCIDYCDKLNKNLNQRQKDLKQKLLLFLYSLDENKNEILNDLEKNDIIEPSLREEIIFLETIRNKKNNINILENLIKEDTSNEMKLNIYREIAISYFKEENYDKCMNYLLTIINYNNINDIIRNRTMLDYCYVFKKLFTKENKDNEKDNYRVIKEKIKLLNQIMKKPIRKDIYYESYYLRNEIFYLLEPDIVMLNSNPLKNKSNNTYSLNNQYYILNELKNKINIHIRLDSKILNFENLNEILNKKGEILIIQLDDFIKEKNKFFICESQKGKSYKLYFEDIIKLIKKKEFNYKVIILCFPNSYLLKDYFDNNQILYSNIIYFDYIDFSKYDIINKYNSICIQFIIDFIKNSVNYDNIENIFNLTKKQFSKNINQIKSKFINENNVHITIKNKNNSEIKYHREIDENKIYLYNPLPKINNLTIFGYNPKDYSLKVYNLIEKINNENNAIFYCDKSNKNYYLKLSIETMKYFHRHKTYCELFYIDIQNGDKNLLKSIIRKLNKLMIQEEEKSEKEEDEQNEEESNIKQKVCFILINNCTQLDLLDVNIYSILKSDSSFIIIYDTNNDENNKNNVIKEIKNIETNEIALINKNIIDQQGTNFFFIRYDSNKLEIIDDNFVKSYLKEKETYKIGKFDTDKFKNNFINKRLEIFPNGNLSRYISIKKPLEGNKNEFPFKEDEAKLLFYEIIQLVKKLHDNYICHLDLKIENIMLDKNYKPILLNFGTAKKYGKKINSSDFKLNEYSPPELYSTNSKLDGFKIDIFSLGIILFKLLFVHAPFTKPLNQCKYYEYIKQQKFNEFWKSELSNKNLEITDEFKNLFINMVTYYPNKRFTLKEILNSNWMKEINKFIFEKSKELNYIENELYNNFNSKSKFIKDERDKIYMIPYEESEIENSKDLYEEKQAFSSELRPKIKNEDDKFNFIIKINETSNIYNLMNELYSNLEYKFGDNSISETSEDKLELTVTENTEEETKEEELQYSLKLYQNSIKRYYFLCINYLSGNLEKFYDRIELLKKEDIFNETLNSTYKTNNSDESRNLELCQKNITESGQLAKQKLIQLDKDTIFYFECKVDGNYLKLILSEVSALAPFIYEKILSLEDIYKVSEIFKSCPNLENVKEHIDRLFENKKIKLSSSKNNKIIYLEFSAFDISNEVKFEITTLRKMTDDKEDMLLKLYSIQKHNLKIFKDIETYLKSNKNINKNELDKIMKLLKEK